MASRKYDAATVTLSATELKLPMMDCSVEDVYKELTVFKTPAKIWLETKGPPDHKQFIFTLQLLGKEGLYCGESLPLLVAPDSNDKE